MSNQNSNINLQLFGNKEETPEDIKNKYEAKKVQYEEEKKYQEFLEKQKEKQEKEDEKGGAMTIGDLLQSTKDAALGHTVGVKYEVKQEPLLSVEAKIALAIISTLIMGYFVFFFMLIYFAPVFFTIQSRSISFTFKLILSIISLVSPFTLLPITLVFTGPYHIYTSYMTMFKTDILYMFNTVIGMDSFSFTQDGMSREYVSNLGSFLGYLFYIFFMILVAYTSYTMTKSLLPRLFDTKDKVMNPEDVSLSYYEENKDKDIQQKEESWISVSKIFGGLRRIVLGF